MVKLGKRGNFDVLHFATSNSQSHNFFINTCLFSEPRKEKKNLAGALLYKPDAISLKSQGEILNEKVYQSDDIVKRNDTDIVKSDDIVKRDDIAKRYDIVKHDGIVKHDDIRS